MTKQNARLSLLSLAILIFAFSRCVPSMASPRPLRKSELLALVAGGALPENVTVEIGSRGLGFRPDNSFRSQLEVAGANSAILHALDSAKTADASPDDRSDKELF